MALIVAAAMAMPNMQIRLLFIGIIKLKWVAIGTILISMLGITSSNAGGEIAHIGGATGGWLWAVLLRKNIELTKPIDWIISLFTNIFKILFDRKPKLRHTNRKYHYVKPDEQSNVSQRENNRNLDAILDKIRKSGYSSLTEEEKKQLFDISQKV
jgi:rhomboid family protein